MKNQKGPWNVRVKKGWHRETEYWGGGPYLEIRIGTKADGPASGYHKEVYSTWNEVVTFRASTDEEIETAALVAHAPELLASLKSLTRILDSSLTLEGEERADLDKALKLLQRIDKAPAKFKKEVEK